MVNEGLRKKVSLCFLLLFFSSSKLNIHFAIPIFILLLHLKILNANRCLCFGAAFSSLSWHVMCLLLFFFHAPGEWKSRNAYRDILSRFKCLSTAGVFGIWHIRHLPSLMPRGATQNASRWWLPLIWWMNKKTGRTKKRTQFAGASGSMEKTLNSEMESNKRTSAYGRMKQWGWLIVMRF